VNSETTDAFWKLHDRLPLEVQTRAREAYRLWRDNPAHPGLNFKRVSRTRPVYSVRIGLQHRALGVLEGDSVIWFWIGLHDEYERIINTL
jgi:hypothetical protein